MANVPAKKPVHVPANNRALDFVEDYAKALMLQAKALAYRRGDDMVLSSHVVEAERLLRPQHRRRRSDQVYMILGGALFGAFLQGFVSEVTGQLDAVSLSIYTVLGFVGLWLIIWRLLR